jgi:D-3-phosphoglycerate dehydrogenase
MEMDELFKEADIISIHTPLTDETKFLVNNDWINKFEKDFYLINTARGKIVNTEDLYLALLNGKIKGACLDVLEYEKTSFENIEKSEASETFTDILNLDNVIFSPHIAGWTYESKIKLAKFLGDKILNWLEK